MELNGPPPQWLVVFSLGRLSLQVQQAAVCLTDYYWFPDGLSVRCQYTCRSGGGKQTQNTLFIPPSSLSFLPFILFFSCIHLTFLFWPHLLVPFSSFPVSLYFLYVHVNNFYNFLVSSCSLNPSLHSPQSLPWSPLLSSSVKHLMKLSKWVKHTEIDEGEPWWSCSSLSERACCWFHQSKTIYWPCVGFSPTVVETKLFSPLEKHLKPGRRQVSSSHFNNGKSLKGHKVFYQSHDGNWTLIHTFQY